MPFDTKDIFGFDNLYVSGKDKEFNSEYTPLGTGRKSQYALGCHFNENDSSANEIKTSPKKKAHSTAKSAGAKKKSSSEGSTKKKQPKGTMQQASKKRQTTGGKKHTHKKTSPTGKKTEYVQEDTGVTASSVRAAEKKKKPAATKTSTKKAASKRKSKKKRSVKEEVLSYAYLGAMAAGGIVKALFGTRRKRAVAAILLLVVLVIGCGFYVKSMYTSKTMFADDGKELDETAIQERLITDEQNKDKVTYFLIVGVDKSQKLTDCIWLMCFDNAAHKMNVMQIPRDTYVGSDSIGRGKINAVYKTPKTVNWCETCGKEVSDEEIQFDSHTVCGTKVTQRTESNINALIRVINRRLKLPVDHYVLFDFKGFEKVIDAMGGVDIELEEEMKVYPNKKTYITLHAGVNHLDGATALKYMRTRKNYANGDLGRVKGQRRLIKSMFEKVDRMSSVEALTILTAAYGNFKTDMSLEEIRSFIAPVKKCGADNLHMFELPGHDRWVKPHPSFYVCDEERAVEEINQYLLPYSEKLTAEDLDFPDLGY